jgi:drug/metabolite transporter (DMT)-like permease
MDRNILKYGIVIGVSLFSGYGFQTVGLQYTTPANAGFITGLSVVVVPFLSVLFIKKGLHVYSYVGVVCAAAGLFSLSFQKFEMNYGDFLMLLCAFSFALHIVLVGKYAPLYDPVLLTTVQIGVVAVLSFLLSLNQEPVFTTMVWKTVIVTSLFATVLAFLIQNLAQQHTPPTRTAVIFAMEPVFAALCSFILIHEVFTLRKVAGCILILLGMVITELKKA